ncbi:acyl-CoA N-acyltransferase [Lophiotrema nucula]|uniref:N-alpha-acetyltransferase 40 n=1 Tax=Lophiotrema nucula TaxID=690887 RepID=A0A6A5YZT9_9PLEO|nr:acyl-CoA N-acyltransferase [Lophiotrema nucula]
MASNRGKERENEDETEDSACRMEPKRIMEALPRDDALLQYTTRKQAHVPITITLKHSADIADEELAVCFDLIETSSSADYKTSSGGWHPDAKKEEMIDPQMWYLLARRTTRDDPVPVKAMAPILPSSQAPAPVIGFLSFMFTNDDDPPERTVLYIYEVHLAEEMRSCGLGSHLVHIAETLAKRCGIDKAMLTVFTANKLAIKLYENLGYEKDACSPADRVVRRRVIEAEYKILSKLQIVA